MFLRYAFASSDYTLSASYPESLLSAHTQVSRIKSDSPAQRLL